MTIYDIDNLSFTVLNELVITINSQYFHFFIIK